MKGFTLIELMIVVAIIAIIAAIAIPNLLESQTASWQTAAAGTLRTMSTTLQTFCIKFNDLPPNEKSLRGSTTGVLRLLFDATDDLVLAGTQDCPTVGPAAAKTYTFTYVRASAASWSCTADTDRTDIQDFYVDNGGVLRAVISAGDGASATSLSDPFSG